MAYVRVFLGIIGFGFCIAALMQFTTWIKGTAEPEVVTLRELASDDRPNNIHLTVTDFVFQSEYIQGGITKNSISEAWIPMLVVEEDGSFTSPERPVIAHVDHIQDDAQYLDEVFLRTEVTGLVANRLDALDARERAHLRDVTDNANLTQAIVINIDEKFPSLFAILGFVTLGSILIAICIWLSLKAANQPEEVTEIPSMKEFQATSRGNSHGID